MKTKLFFPTMFTLVLSSLISLSSTLAQEAPSRVRYRLVDLGADNAIGNDISDCRQVIGSKDYGDERHATFWPNLHSSPIDLGTVTGALGSRGMAINRRGQMVGWGGGVPLFWANGHSAAMELAGTPLDAAGYAADINRAGQIVGQFSGDSGISPIFWSGSTAPATYLLPASDQFPNGAAFSINDAGNIFGDSCDADFVECHGAFWASSTSVPVQLASPDDEFIYTDVGFPDFISERSALSNAGSMVGFAINADFSEFRAVYWASSSSPAVILSTNDDYPNGFGEGINNQGQIIGTGYSSDLSTFHPFFWRNANSPGIDLNTVIPAGWEMVLAHSINNRGEITGAAFLDGDESQHAVVLIPLRGD
jgi:uncharacterized membrane protein